MLPGMLWLFFWLLIFWGYSNVLIYRLSVKLPGIAVGRHDFGFAKVWAATKGNSLRILGLSVLLGLVGWLASSFLEVLLSSLVPWGASAAILYLVALSVFIWVQMILGITVLTSLYGFFVMGWNFESP